MAGGNLFPHKVEKMWLPDLCWKNQQKTAGSVSGVVGRNKGGDGGMTAEQSLLDLLSIQMGCMYLSDLRFLLPEQRRYLAQRLDWLTPRQEDIREWNDALDYLTGAPPEDTAQAAKERLIKLLQKT